MDSTATKIIAVIVVIALIGAGVGIVIMLNQKSNSDDVQKAETKLAVYGNVNGDLEINEDDVNMIQDLVNEKAYLVDHPLADANCDGILSQDDVDFTRTIIDKSTTFVYIQCLSMNGNTISQKVDYPLKNIVGVGTNMMPVMISSGIKSSLAGYYGSSSYTNMQLGLSGVNKIANISRNITAANWTKFTDLDTSLAASGGVGAFLVDHSLGSVPDTSLDQDDDLKERGIPQIRLAVADPIGDINAVMLLGFLVGGDAATTSKTYAEKSWGVIEDIQEKVNGLKDDEKKTYIGVTMWNYVAEERSTFGTLGSYVGGIPYYSVNENFKAKYSGTSSDAMDSTEALSNYAIKSKLSGPRAIDFIFSSRTIDFKTGDAAAINAKIVEDWEHVSGGHKAYEYFENLDCYSNLYYINNLLPGAVKLAYVAAAMYPDLYSKDDANAVADDFNTFCALLNGCSRANTIYYFSLSDYTAAKAA